MDQRWILELVGYVASALVAISLMMSSILKLRVINLFGSAFFTIYGVLIGAYPVAVVNLFIVFINLYYLRQMLGTKEYFKLLEIKPDSDYLRYFLSFYQQEIGRFLPDFAFRPAENQLIFFILRDMIPAGLFIGEVQDRDSLLVQLDFVIPSFRDFKTGTYLFSEHAEFFRQRGIREIVSAGGSREHAAYLHRMGFVPADSENQASMYRLAVA
ncbi:hypothetical protein BH23GEM5_BH23GEM5_04550 [soil metagenome]